MIFHVYIYCICDAITRLFMYLEQCIKQTKAITFLLNPQNHPHSHNINFTEQITPHSYITNISTKTVTSFNKLHIMASVR